MLEVLSGEPLLQNSASIGEDTVRPELVEGQVASAGSGQASTGSARTESGFAPRPDYRPQTKFETRGLRLGHGVWDVVFTRRAESSATAR